MSLYGSKKGWDDRGKARIDGRYNLNRRYSMPTIFTHERVIPRSHKSWIGEIKNVIHNPWFWVIFSGYLLRVVFMPLTGQHDVMFMPWQAHFMIVERNLNVYALLYMLFGDIVMNHPGVWAPYPFGFYSLTAVWEWVLNGSYNN